jgi:chromosome segregation protein
MLKRLELVGFKSFAEKTQFDFPPGITAIVGPNGSGKSNIVDAVRWVLGEQSAKSLRGGEMADVIFNGSTSRRSLGLAEVTMTFDNARRILATEADEVQISRRVYRDGEGEYLINRQLTRLKDVRDLFLGSGAGGDAYCVIEQGRVDVLLQASTKERRTIFEEAAGISRFKAKKIEALRKLERVDQNLQRLRDIIDEVEKQLRSVKLQAAKAQRYQEYSNRLKELRVSLGFREFQQLTAQFEAETVVLDGLRAGLEEQARQVETWESDARRLEENLARLDQGIHEQETLLAGARQAIAAAETTLSHESSTTANLESDLARIRSGMMEISSRVAALAEAAAEAGQELHSAQTQAQTRQEALHTLEETLQRTTRQLAELKDQLETDKANHLEQMRQAARLQNDAVSYKAQVDNLHRERERLRLRTEQAAEHLASLDLELRDLANAEDAVQARLAKARQDLLDHRQERERVRQLRDRTQELAADLRAQRSGLVSRIEVLEGLERSHEGLGTGVREVLELLEQHDPGPWRTVLGILADFLTVRHEHAILLDLALGERAQRFLVRDVALLEKALRQRGQLFSGRVSFLPLSPARLRCDSTSTDRLIELAHSSPIQAPSQPASVRVHPGIVGPAVQFVTCEQAELADLPTQLLGNTLFVRDLATAREIAATATGYRFVTLDGELLEIDGTLTVGTQHAEGGILSRKSELRELRQEVAAIDRKVAETERTLADLRDQVVRLDSQAQTQQEEIDVLNDQAGDLRTRIGQHRQRLEGLHEEVVVSRHEISGVEQEVQNLELAWERARGQADAAEQQVHLLQTRLLHADREIRERDQERQQAQEQCTSAQVILAQTEERLAALRAKHRQIEADLEQRRQEQLLGEEQLSATRIRLAQSQHTMLQASTALAHGYLEKEAAERKLAELAQGRQAFRRERHLLSEQAQAARSVWQAKQEQAHARELVVNDLRHHRDTLVDRLREDYQVNLAELHANAVADGHSPSCDEPDMAQEGDANSPSQHLPVVPINPDTVNEEIAELRRKLGRLGSVNLDSLEELAGMETRAHTLHTQSDDLVAAKQSLEEIIAKINRDSRRQFIESFSSIRTHFQELFRKLFGGGMADILLEDENDVLESGIEIIARPPGKELLNLSLMSGGEKTLTAVALLLAIFRSKPSPFCILDEVDAALDEANIGRFTAVLREFLDQSHFILITHSKRTMSVADVLYGITMQESGVSKRVAVRFEDWPENGQAETPEAAVATRNGHDGPGHAEHDDYIA